MPNTTITFTAKRNLVSGILADDQISLQVTLTAFDKSADVSKKTSIAMDGVQEESSLFYIGSNYSLTCLDYGTVLFPNATTTPLTTEYMEMFFYSVAASELFTVTNLDDSDVEFTAQLRGAWSRSRKSAADTNKFTYSFSVREILE